MSYGSADRRPPVQRESWYNMPGTSPYELNNNVSVPQGPSWGPKASIFSKHKLTTKQGVFIGAGILIVVLLAIVLISRQRAARAVPTFYF
jgi:hypothetical protein